MYNVVGMWSNKKIKGFTLIELLITVGVIAVLSVGMFSLVGPGSRRFARDSRRQTDLQTIVAAMAMYRNDQGQYPICPGGAVSCNISSVAGLAPLYLQTIPPDPLGWTYRYAPATTLGAACNGAATRCGRFMLCAGSEKDTTTNNNATCGGDCGAGHNCVFMERNP